MNPGLVDFSTKLYHITLAFVQWLLLNSSEQLGLALLSHPSKVKIVLETVLFTDRTQDVKAGNNAMVALQYPHYRKYSVLK